MNVEITPAAPDEAEAIARMAKALTDEIIGRTGARHFELDLATLALQCRQFLREGIYSVLLARDAAGGPLGFAALCESHALYAGGVFGVIQEFYVVPAARSHGVGARLLTAVRRYARERKWKRLELCTPPLPEFDRALAFYESNGFEITGGRKMKLTL
jgi:GNAT superfamily N-acetyltransferase